MSDSSSYKVSDWMVSIWSIKSIEQSIYAVYAIVCPVYRVHFRIFGYFQFAVTNITFKESE